MIFRLAALELWRSRRWTALFILNLSLGIVGFLTLTSYREALRENISANAKNILSADLSLSARKEIPDETINAFRTELQKNIPNGSISESIVYDFFAMMSFKDSSRLVLVKAIDDNYPFYGTIELEGGKIVDSTPGSKAELINNGIYLYPELSQTLGIKKSNEVKLGQLTLQAKDFVTKDSTQTFRLALLAPKVYIHRSLLAKSGLIQFGSTFTKAYLFKTQSPDPNYEVSPATIEKLNNIVTDPAIRIDTPISAGEDSGRQLSYLSDFLGLVSIVSLILSALGASYLFRLFFSQQLKDISIYRVLGVSDSQLHLILGVQALLLSLGSLLLGLVGAVIFTPILNEVLSKFSTITLNPRVDLQSVALGFLISFISSYLLILPHLSAVLKTSLQKVFSAQLDELEYSWTSLSGLVFFLVFIYILSVSQTKSFFIGSIFFGALIGSLVVLYFVGYFVLSSLKYWKTKSWIWKQVFLKISRDPKEYSVFFVTLGVAVLLINIIPQLRAILSQDLSVSPNSPVPSSFMFDIQDEQREPLEKFLHEKNLKSYFSPMIRARIVSVNENPYERSQEDSTLRTREEEEDARFRNRGINLSYRPELLPSEIITDGEDFPMEYSSTQSMPYLSLEEKYADRLKLKLGDQMKFDVQGVEITGVVRNMRRIKWTSFQPNFFVLIQKGVIDEAPKTYLASISGIQPPMMSSFVGESAKLFPNISIIDVKRLIDDVMELLEKMSSALQLMSGLAILVGSVLLFAIIRTHGSQRRRQINLFKILGAKENEIQRILLSEYLFISIIASLFGAILSLVVSGILGLYIFKAGFTFSWQEPLGVLVAVMIFTYFLVLSSTRGVIKEHPQRILNEEN